MTKWYHDWPSHMAFWRPTPLIATWGGSGLLKPGSGTWGTVAAIPPAILLVWLAGPWGLAAGAIILFFIGWWAAHDVAERANKPDWSAIVVDEVVGVWIALLPVAMSPRYWLPAFIAFRVFDIVKRGPVGWADSRFKGGLGVMLDDVIAGIMAAIVMLGLLAVFGGR